MRRLPRTLKRMIHAAALLFIPLAAAGSPQPIDVDAAIAKSQGVLGAYIGAHGFADGDGKRVSFADYRGRLLVVNFVYSGCSQVCPATTRWLATAVKEARKALGADTFDVVSIGFNVPYDNPVSLRAFARNNGIDDARWSFLTPDAADVEALARDFGFSYAATAGGYDHLTQVTIIDRQGRIYRQLYGESFALPMLITPLKDLVLDAPVAAPGFAGLVEKMRILCTVYDPQSGKYRLNYGLFIELGAGISCLGFTLWYLVHEWRRRRRMRAQSAQATMV
jgi:protein SCO1/2